MGKDVLEPARPQMTIWGMRIACWKPKATNTRLGYVIVIAFQLRRWLNKRSSLNIVRTLPVLLWHFLEGAHYSGCSTRRRWKTSVSPLRYETAVTLPFAFHEQRGVYLALRDRKWQEVGENCVYEKLHDLYLHRMLRDQTKQKDLGTTLH
jgi:hypothetical protein